MRIRAAAGAATLAVVLSGLMAAPGVASRHSKIGILEVGKTITLNFPKPGVYYGIVKLGKKKKVVRAPIRDGKKPPRKTLRRGAAAAARECDIKAKVAVVHLSKPPFKIGGGWASRIPGARAFQYTVMGAEPPTGDKVLASSGTFASRNTWEGFSWKSICRGDKVIRPYPF
jgi:hypothetical protein